MKSQITTTADSINQQLLTAIEDLSHPEPASDEKMSQKIMGKLKCGKKLTSKELSWLQKNNPWLYQQAVRIQQMIENVEEQCRHAQSKKKIQNIQWNAIRSVSDKDPVKEYMMAAIQNTIHEVESSAAYQFLPTEDPDEDKSKESTKLDKEQIVLRRHMEKEQALKQSESGTEKISAITKAVLMD